MKKITLFLFLLVILGVTEMSAQTVNWGNSFETPSSKSVLTYVGHEEDTYYYYYDYQSWGLFTTPLDDITFVAIKNGTILKTSEKTDIKRGSLESVFLEKGKIHLLYSYFDKNNDVYNINRRIFDTKTLSLQAEKTLLTFESTKKNVNSIYVRQSPDHSKLMIAYMDVNKKTKVGFLNTTVFDDSFGKLWQKQYSPKKDGLFSIQDFFLEDDGTLTILGSCEQKEGKTIRNRSFMIVNLGDDISSEVAFHYPVELELQSIKSILLPENRVFVAGLDKYVLKGFVLNVESGDVETKITSSLAENLYWNIDCIKLLENGNLVVVCEDNYVVKLVRGASEEFQFINRNIRFIGINPEKKEPLYNKLIVRATASSNGVPYSIWEAEKPSYFVNENNLYALYNTSKKCDELQGEAEKNVQLWIKKNKKKSVSNVLRISPNGDLTLNTFIRGKEDRACYIPLVDEQIEGNKVVIAKVEKLNMITLGTLELK